MNRNKLGLSMTILALFFSGCGFTSGKKNRKSIDDESVKQYFLNGDPNNLLKDSDLNYRPIFNLKNYKEFSDYNFYGGVEFSNRSEVTQKDQDRPSVEEENKASGKVDLNQVSHYQFVEENGKIQFKSTADNTGKSLVFNFEPNQNQELTLKSALANGEEYSEFKVIYESITQDQSAFSLTIKLEQDGTNSMTVLYFVKNLSSNKEIELADSTYNYLLGPGVKTKWPGDIELNLCGSMTNKEQSWVNAIATQWAPKGLVGSTPFKIKNRDVKLPFMDVNARCIKYVDDYLAGDREDSTIFGVTITAVDKTSQMIRSSVILMFRAGFTNSLNKVVASEGEKYRDLYENFVHEKTEPHEFGHFLGLDHEFDKNDQGSSINSIMSYNFSDTTVTTYDKSAVEALYGPYPKSYP